MSGKEGPEKNLIPLRKRAGNRGVESRLIFFLEKWACGWGVEGPKGTCIHRVWAFSDGGQRDVK